MRIAILLCLCVCLIGCEMSEKPIAYRGQDGKWVFVGVGDTLRITLTGDLVKITGRENFLSNWWYVEDIKTGRKFKADQDECELP